MAANKADRVWDYVGHHTRVVGTSSGRGPATWQAWCEESGCYWRGRTWPHGHGNLACADAEAEHHRSSTALPDGDVN
jgi:hypothetical protein